MRVRSKEMMSGIMEKDTKCRISDERKSCTRIAGNSVTAPNSLPEAVNSYLNIKGRVNEGRSF